MAADKKPINTEDIHISDVDTKLHKSIRTMVKRHEKMWDGTLGDTTVTERRIEFNPDARLVKDQKYRTGPKTRKSCDSRSRSNLRPA